MTPTAGTNTLAGWAIKKVSGGGRTDENLREAVRRIIHKFWEDARKDPNLQSTLPTLKSYLSKARFSALEALLLGFLEVKDDVLDGHVDMLNAQNGVIDLKTGERVC